MIRYLLTIPGEDLLRLEQPRRTVLVTLPADRPDQEADLTLEGEEYPVLIVSRVLLFSGLGVHGRSIHWKTTPEHLMHALHHENMIALARKIQAKCPGETLVALSSLFTDALREVNREVSRVPELLASLVQFFTMFKFEDQYQSGYQIIRAIEQLVQTFDESDSSDLGTLDASLNAIWNP